jgi:hypothetical protein
MPKFELIQGLGLHYSQVIQIGGEKGKVEMRGNIGNGEEDNMLMVNTLTRYAKMEFVEIPFAIHSLLKSYSLCRQNDK